MTLRERLYSEFVAGKSWLDWALLALGLALQILVFCLQPQSWVVVVSSLAGVFSVVLCSQGKISSFFFGFVQVSTYMLISYEARLYGEVAINIFYFLSMIYGVFSWRQSYDVHEETGEASLSPRRLDWLSGCLIALLTLTLSGVVGYLLGRFTDDSQPYLDAFTTVPAIAAQLLMVFRYRDQWFYWLAIDMVAAVMWFRADNLSMMALYLFWCIVCLYGFRNWSKQK